MPDWSMEAALGYVHTAVEMAGFKGCTDRNPEICACATNQDVECEVCAEVIEPGQLAIMVVRPEYPHLSADDSEQSYEYHWAHEGCSVLAEPTANLHRFQP